MSIFKGIRLFHSKTCYKDLNISGQNPFLKTVFTVRIIKAISYGYIVISPSLHSLKIKGLEEADKFPS